MILARSTFMLGAGALALTGATPPPNQLRVTIEVRRQSQDMLAAMLIGIYVENRGTAPITYTFTQADIFNVAVQLHGEHVWDARYGQRAVPVVRKVSFDRGRALLQSYTWDGTATNKRSMPAGAVTISATLMTPVPQVATLTLPFVKPLPIAQLEKVKLESEATVAGIAGIRRGAPVLTDESGTIVLSRRLAPSAQGMYVARGFLKYTPDGLVLNVTRAAPAFENLDPVAPAPSPAPPASPTPFAAPTASKTVNANQESRRFSGRIETPD